MIIAIGYSIKHSKVRRYVRCLCDFVALLIGMPFIAYLEKRDQVSVISNGDNWCTVNHYVASTANIISFKCIIIHFKNTYVPIKCRFRKNTIWLDKVRTLSSKSCHDLIQSYWNRYSPAAWSFYFYQFQHDCVKSWHGFKDNVWIIESLSSLQYV